MRKKTANKEWLKERLRFEKKCGQSNDFYTLLGAVFYLVPCDGGEALISEELPNMKDWSLNMFATNSSRRVQPPKKIRQYKNAIRDYRWEYHRKVVAADHIKGLPNVEAFLNCA